MGKLIILVICLLLAVPSCLGAAVTESELYSAVTKTWQTASSTLDGDFSAVGAPAFDGTPTVVPGTSRSDNFMEYDGTNDNHTFTSANVLGDTTQGILSLRIKPNESQSGGGGNRAMFGTFNGSNGILLQFNDSNNDFQVVIWGTGGVVSAVTSGLSWSANDVLNIVLLYKGDVSLDSSKSVAIYVNNSLEATGTTAWADSKSWDDTSEVAANGVASRWNGGIQDIVWADYDSLAATHTDAEIVQSFYVNSFGVAGAHVWGYELDGEPPASVGSTFTSGNIINNLINGDAQEWF